MARRRRKKDPIDEIIPFLLLLTFFLMFGLSKSMLVSVVTTSVIFGVLLGIKFYISRLEEERLKQSGIKEIDNMDGLQFEKYLAVLFRSLGYKTEETNATGDYGADLILTKNDRKIVVQAKRYSKNVGIKAVQEVFGAKNFYNAQEVWVITNRYFTEAAINLAKVNNVRLINRDDLIDLILKVNYSRGQSVAKKIIEETPKRVMVCNRCGSKMVRRKSARGEFYGCSRFPRCRNIKAV